MWFFIHIYIILYNKGFDGIWIVKLKLKTLNTIKQFISSPKKYFIRSKFIYITSY